MENETARELTVVALVGSGNKAQITRRGKGMACVGDVHTAEACKSCGTWRLDEYRCIKSCFGAYARKGRVQGVACDTVSG